MKAKKLTMHQRGTIFIPSYVRDVLELGERSQLEITVADNMIMLKPCGAAPPPRKKNHEESKGSKAA